MITMSIDDMKKQLESRLKPSRYQHSLGVMDTAVFLAGRFGVDEEKARVAGLLHDCARQYPNAVMREEADRRGLVYSSVEAAMPLLLHAYIGAALVREDYGVEDEEISRAIYRHTVAGAGMSKLDKIIWFADMIEPSRDFPQVGALRELARTADLDTMLLEGLSQSIAFVTEKGHMIHPDTVLARNEILLRRMAKR